jgi:hypothetical protein
VNRRALTLTGVLLALGIGIDTFVGYSPFPGYGALIGLVGCIVITAVSKWLGSTFLQRSEGYLGDDAIPHVQPEVIGDPTHPDAQATRGADVQAGEVRGG